MIFEVRKEFQFWAFGARAKSPFYCPRRPEIEDSMLEPVSIVASAKYVIETRKNKFCGWGHDFTFISGLRVLPSGTRTWFIIAVTTEKFREILNGNSE